MKKALLINLSPKSKGTSARLLKYCKEYIEKEYSIEERNVYKNATEEIVEQFLSSDIIIFIGPCYINTFPADTFLLLEELSKNKARMKQQKVYGIIQGGMPYYHTHHSGLQALSLFCKECDISYMGGFVLGGGAMMNGRDIEVLPNSKRMKKQFYLFLENVRLQQYSEALIYQKAQMRIPKVGSLILSKILNRDLKKRYKEAGVYESEKSRGH